MGWLLFFYSVPSRPVSNRVRIWRRLSKAGAVQFKGAAYLLPSTEEHRELLQWLTSEVDAMKGEAAFIEASAIETMKDIEVMELFIKQRGKEYGLLAENIDGLERKANSVRKGGQQDIKKLRDELIRVEKELESIKAVDFFPSKACSNLSRQIQGIHTCLKNFSFAPVKKQKVALPVRKIEDYKGKTWVTRKRPFIDRMASAWLIRKFIDNAAAFKFIEEKDVEGLGNGAVPFDIRGGEFTHIGDFCTFEVLVKTFGFKDKTLKKISEIVHELDVKDDKYKNPESKGIEGVLAGIRRTARHDSDCLEKGMAVFEMLYASKR